MPFPSGLPASGTRRTLLPSAGAGRRAVSHHIGQPVNNIGAAFSFPFKDPAWVSKTLLACVFAFLSLFLFGLFILMGYFVGVSQRVIRGEQHALPAWTDLGAKFVTGFKLFVVHFLYLLPMMLVYIPFLIIIGVTEAIGNEQMDPALAGISAVFAALSVLFLLPYGLAYTVLSPIINYRFARNESIGEAMDIGAVVRTFRKNWQSTVIVALIAAGLQSVLAGAGIVLMIIGVLATIVYSYFVSFHLYGQLALEHAPSEAAVPPAPLPA